MIACCLAVVCLTRKSSLGPLDQETPTGSKTIHHPLSGPPFGARQQCVPAQDQAILCREPTLAKFCWQQLHSFKGRPPWCALAAPAESSGSSAPDCSLAWKQSCPSALRKLLPCQFCVGVRSVADKYQFCSMTLSMTVDGGAAQNLLFGLLNALMSSLDILVSIQVLESVIGSKPLTARYQLSYPLCEPDSLPLRPPWSCRPFFRMCRSTLTQSMTQKRPCSGGKLGSCSANHQQFC